ncbi:AAC(3) family N-acetyltransferase [Lachnospiraceae bacterium 45-W7]
MDRETVLAERRGRKLTYGEYVDALRAVGLQAGDTICVHSDLPQFGRTRIARGAYEQAFVEGLLEVIGTEGTLIMPTFSYSFCKGEVFDVQNTKSDVGCLTEHFRKLPGVIRTAEPIFSFALSGKNAERYLAIGESCFSRDSMYGKLLDDDAKIVFLGSHMGATFNHYVEAQMEVPYRFMKRFSGIVRNNDEQYETYRDFFVRYLDRDSMPDADKLDKFYIETGIIHMEYIGEATISSIRCVRWFEEAEKKYRQDPTYFLIKEKKGEP